MRVIFVLVCLVINQAMGNLHEQSIGTRHANDTNLYLNRILLELKTISLRFIYSFGYGALWGPMGPPSLSATISTHNHIYIDIFISVRMRMRTYATAVRVYVHVQELQPRAPRLLQLLRVNPALNVNDRARMTLTT